MHVIKFTPPGAESVADVTIKLAGILQWDLDDIYDAADSFPQNTLANYIAKAVAPSSLKPEDWDEDEDGNEYLEDFMAVVSVVGDEVNIVYYDYDQDYIDSENCSESDEDDEDDEDAGEDYDSFGSEVCRVD